MNNKNSLAYTEEQTNNQNPTTHAPAHWHAFLTMGFAQTRRGVALKTCEHKGPLYVQKPFYPEGQDRAHIYLLHPPGGLVSGDRLTITSNQQDDTNVLITTPGAGRVYKARADKSLQHQVVQLNIGEHSQLEWLPQETLLYPEAQTKLDTHINLAEGAKFIGWEVTCFGLTASEQPFEQGQVSQCIQIKRHQRLVLKERLFINDTNRHLLTSASGLRQHTVNGFMVAGPFADENEEKKGVDKEPTALIELLRQASNKYDQQGVTGISFVSGFIVIRLLGPDSEQAKRAFTQYWTLIRPALLGIPVCQPRIWAT
ncbi:urease accessory protein UreD [Marinomonas algicola]|uniref:urease accessory protein UreD n=1 Tax=Marinomonas algicola TaxID=2773454 RepID=UPI00174AE8FB|nr:urease accessory protein UreD [Marinomonas algicola]